MAAIVGAAGLAPTLAAIRRGAIVGFANKEVLVCAGALVHAARSPRTARRCCRSTASTTRSGNASISHRVEGIEKITLTCSGGPFRERAVEDMRAVTPEQAVAHPNWRMGAKISVDSATLMNKGLEVIEAHHLFRTAVRAHRHCRPPAIGRSTAW